jgi:hypothetical protein
MMGSNFVGNNVGKGMMVQKWNLEIKPFVAQ